MEEKGSFRRLARNLRRIDDVKGIFKQICKKPIYVCSEQTIVLGDEVFEGVPRCDHIEVSWEDWLKLHDAIDKLPGV